MKVKYSFVIILVICIGGSVSQLFTIPPFAGDIFKIYKSGYFSELDRGFDIVTDAFIETKMLSRPVYAWLLLDDIKSRHGMSIKVYNNSGFQVNAPGSTGTARDEQVQKILSSLDPRAYSAVRGKMYFYAAPVFLEDRCRFCHSSGGNRNIAGVLTFERGFNASIYYSSERMIIFGIITTVLLVLLFIVLRWDPEKKVKELFDKS